jgi:uncharacterized membrane protein
VKDWAAILAAMAIGTLLAVYAAFLFVLWLET